MARDDFSQSTKDILARRVAFRCSNPSCRVLTCGPHTESNCAVNVGVAAHITAAASGGPRYEISILREQRMNVGNGIWLCQTCAKLIDSDSAKYPSDLLKEWKILAEQQTAKELTGIPESEFFPQPSSATHTPIPIITNLTYEEARERLIKAGWQPRLNHWSHSSNFDMQYGNGLHFWNKGYHEIRHASGTGLSFCSFGFIDVYGHQLVIVTAGEIIEESNTTASIWGWHFEPNDGTTHC